MALRLFEREGFEQVTMDEVAKAASVSRRTLFRLYPSKSDLVWDGLTGVRDFLKQRAEALPAQGLRLSDVVDGLFLSTLRMLDEPEAEKLARRRLRLIARSPALLSHPALREIEEVIASAVAACALPKGTPASLVARTLVAAAFAALLWWAEHGNGMSALDATVAALKAIPHATGG